MLVLLPSHKRTAIHSHHQPLLVEKLTCDKVIIMAQKSCQVSRQHSKKNLAFIMPKAAEKKCAKINHREDICRLLGILTMICSCLELTRSEKKVHGKHLCCLGGALCHRLKEALEKPFLTTLFAKGIQREFTFTFLLCLSWVALDSMISKPWIPWVIFTQDNLW